jgi:hypothetical protein
MGVGEWEPIPDRRPIYLDLIGISFFGPSFIIKQPRGYIIIQKRDCTGKGRLKSATYRLRMNIRNQSREKGEIVFFPHPPAPDPQPPANLISNRKWNNIYSRWLQRNILMDNGCYTVGLTVRYRLRMKIRNRRGKAKVVLFPNPHPLAPIPQDIPRIEQECRLRK